MTSHPPTDEQAHILDLVRTTDEPLMLNALAGTGKSTTLNMMDWKPNGRPVSYPVLYLVFNRRNADEAKAKQKGPNPEIPTTTVVKTFNGCGHNIWAPVCGLAPNEMKPNGKKCNELLRDIINAAPKDTREELWASYWDVLAGVGLAKALGYIPDGIFPGARRLCTREELHLALEERPDDLTADLIDAVLTASIKAAYAGAIDYNDQIYMPALFGGTFPRFPLVKVDEYQDLNPVNHAMLDKLVHGRIIGVGDPWQNIYGFRGAKQGGMEEAKAKFAMTECDLSISFRCPRAVVEHARWRVPHFKWIKEGGHVERLERMEARDFRDGAAIICRNNAPLFRLGMQLLSAGRSVSIVGSDIGPRLVGIMRKLGDETTNRSSTLALIEDWRAERLANESTTAGDLADCMKVFAEHGATLGQAIAYAEHLFKQSGTLKLLTGHKSKGLEWETVYLLDTWLLREDEQDLNLRYVMQTRSAGALYEIDSNNIQWNP